MFRFARGVLVILVLCFLTTMLSIVNAMPAEPTTTTVSSRTAATTTHIGETIQQLTNQLMEINATSSSGDILTLSDTRTPPKVKQHVKKKTTRPTIQEEIENSHAGIAIPIVDEDDSLLINPNEEETTKKFQQRPTTNSGLSTWILLSGHVTTDSTPQIIKKQQQRVVIKTAIVDENNNPTDDKNQNLTLVAAAVRPNPNRNNNINKPTFKKRPSTTTTTTTTRKPKTTTTEATTTTRKPKTTTTEATTTKLTKIKASLLSTVLNNNKTGINHQNITTKIKKTTSSSNNKKVQTTTMASTEELTDLLENGNNATTPVNSNKLPLEAKEGDVDLTQTDKNAKKGNNTKRPTTTANKRKKNKNRRRRPGDNSTAIAATTKVDKKTSNKNKEKPIGTQLYNYLSREVMPTVGVGLVGLMVTAGLASYFLYPFGVARRSYDTLQDRKDKGGSYYYNNNNNNNNHDDDYSTGIAEEEAIGKVIAGMPSHTFAANKIYRTPSTRTAYSNSNNVVRHRQVDDYNNIRYSEQQPSYNRGGVTSDVIMEQSKETGYTVDDRKFVVGSNMPKKMLINDEVTPAVVPEHGPRSLRMVRGRRHKRDVTTAATQENDQDNEIGADFHNHSTESFISIISTTTASDYQANATVAPASDKYVSFFGLMADLVHLKINLGLQYIQNATQSISRYVTKVQKRFDAHYRNHTQIQQ